jgi:hypothetical protein
MTHILINGIAPTTECPDWTQHGELAKVAHDAWKHIPQTSIEHHVNVECTLVFVNARKPKTFEVAASMVREIAHIKSAMVQRTVPYGDDTTAGRNAGLMNDPAPSVDETREAENGREAIAQHAAAEAEWRAKRGAPQATHEELTCLARRALLRAEMKRTR